ncbi:MAG: DNA repair protein RecO [Methylococcales bacterium]|nr:DNA repair protein RecO [Methylococcales bacterium]
MNDSIVQLQPAFILQHRKYRETSLIIDVLTRDFGVVSILAKGVRKKKSKTAGLLLAFSALKLSYIGRNELKILTHVELDSSIKKLNGLSLYCGFYVNEIVSCFLHKHDPHPEVFAEYQLCLTLLADSTVVEEVLRFFELNLMEHIGYGIQLATDANTDTIVQSLKKYCFRGELGMIESSRGYICGKTLLAMEARKPLDKQALYEAKQLMRRIIDFQSQGKEIKSRAVLAKIIKQI